MLPSKLTLRRATNDRPQKESLDLLYVVRRTPCEDMETDTDRHHSHHCCTLALDGKLHLSPLDKDIKVSRIALHLNLHLFSMLSLHHRKHWTSGQGQVSTSSPSPSSIPHADQSARHLGNVRHCTVPPAIAHTDQGNRDFATEFPNTDVVATDITPVQPAFIPHNLKLLVSPLHFLAPASNLPPMALDPFITC